MCVRKFARYTIVLMYVFFSSSGPIKAQEDYFDKLAAEALVCVPKKKKDVKRCIDVMINKSMHDFVGASHTHIYINAYTRSFMYTALLFKCC